jgi:hypothetical protein
MMLLKRWSIEGARFSQMFYVVIVDRRAAVGRLGTLVLQEVD